MADMDGVLSPKAILLKREKAASEPNTPAPPKAALDPASAGQGKFTKPFTPEERAKQAEALKRFLANRQP